MKKLIALLLTIAIFLTLTACTADSTNELFYMFDGDRAAGADDVGATMPGTYAVGESPMPAGEAESPYDFDMARDGAFDDDMAIMAEPAAMEALDVGGELSPETYPEEYDDRQESVIPAGQLTGGEWNDNRNWIFWTEHVLNIPAWREQTNRWQLNPANRIIVQVTDNGLPVRNAKVVLNSTSSASSILWAARTDHNGIAYLFTSIDKNSQNSANRITVTSGTQSKEITELSEFIQVELTGSYTPVKTLDLMLVFDTTGSMGDELSYLQAEFENIINTVNRNHVDVPVRLSVNFYRDHGDEYLILPYDFTDDVKSAINILKKQSANGGGDYPEALDLALLNAVYEHKWDEDSVKIMILVLDAPCHYNATTIENMKKAIMGAAEQGIRIIPVACSGVDLDAEFLLRCLAMTSGGTYTFLTDHSGIGDPHMEPTIGAYQVEFLNEMLIRIINEYLG
ncbi:MAG: VWA domain-containing protein [Oscillospiraceae bacterium]|nr:VWA domain-containing protein [Oscillospiraceae bacterium]